jgi:phage terminase small subunit
MKLAKNNLTINYNACYEWRKIVLRNEIWSQLPAEIVEIISRYCIKYSIYFEFWMDNLSGPGKQNEWMNIIKNL